MHVHYRPTMDVLDHLANVDFVAVVAPTAAGKTSIINAVTRKEPALHKVLNNTSRAPRPGEREGVDFRFLSKQTMEARIAKGEYVQVAPTVFGDLYATAPEDYSADGIAMLEVLSDAVPVFRSLPFKSVRAIYIVPPSWVEWQRRIKTHNFTPEQLHKRMTEAKKSLEFALNDNHTKFVVNDKLGQAVEDFIALALNRPLSVKLETDQDKARQIVRALTARIQQQYT